MFLYFGWMTMILFGMLVWGVLCIKKYKYCYLFLLKMFSTLEVVEYYMLMVVITQWAIITQCSITVFVLREENNILLIHISEWYVLIGALVTNLYFICDIDLLIAFEKWKRGLLNLIVIVIEYEERGKGEERINIWFSCIE